MGSIKRYLKFVKPYKKQIALTIFVLSLIHISEPTRRS